jgi:hypothetical protein
LNPNNRPSASVDAAPSSGKAGPAAEERGYGGREVGWLGGVDQVTGWDGDQLALRDQAGHGLELILVDVAGRAARDEQSRRLDPPQAIAPGAHLRVGELIAECGSVPVERQLAVRAGADSRCARKRRCWFFEDKTGDPIGVPGRVQVGRRRADRMRDEPCVFRILAESV